MTQKVALLVFAAITCRADLITAGSSPADTFALVTAGQIPTIQTTPATTPPGVVTFAGSEWVTADPASLSSPDEPFEIVMQFFVPPGFDLVGASIGIKTTGPTELLVNGDPLATVTDSTILNDLFAVHAGWNTIQTPGSGAPDFKADIEQYNFGVQGPVPPASTPEPPTLGLVGALLCAGVALKKRTAR